MMNILNHQVKIICDRLHTGQEPNKHI